MDFDQRPETEAIAGLAAQILADHATPERLSALDAVGNWLDQPTWRHLGEAGVVGAALPEEWGGAGLGFLELHAALEEVGRAAAQVPLWESVVLGGLALARHGDDDLRDRLLPGVTAGETVLTAALLEPGSADPRAPRARAVRRPGGWWLGGTKTQVPLLALADHVLVSATVADGTAAPRRIVAVVPAEQLRERATDQASVSRRPASLVELDGVEVDDAQVLADPDVDVLGELVGHAEAGLAALQAGVTASALARTAAYTSGREQFGRPIATFQAVRQRLADAYVDAEAVRLTSLQAAWQLAEGEDATEAIGVAAYWAAEGGHRVLATAQHLHGGIGIDLDYPLHRWFRLGKHVEATLGGAGRQVRRLGGMVESGDLEEAR